MAYQTRERHRAAARSYRLAAGILVAGLLYAAAAGAQAPAGDYLNVVGWVPLDDEALKDQFVIFFDKPIQLPPGPDGSPQAPWTIQPPLNGVPSLGPNYIAFKQAQVSLGVAVVYDVTLNPALQSVDGKPLNPQQQHVFLKTFVFGVAGLSIERISPEQTIARVLFTAPVAVDAARPHVGVVDAAKQPVAATIEQGSNAETLRIVVPGGPPPNARVVISEGLPDVSGHAKLKAGQSFPFPEEEGLAVAMSLNLQAAVGTVQISLGFSRAVSMQQLGQYLTLQDTATGAAIPYDIVTVEDSTDAVVQPRPTEPEPKQIKVQIAAGLPAIDQGKLMTAFSGTLDWAQGGARPYRLGVQQTYWDEPWYGEAREGVSLHVQLNQGVDIEQIRSHIEIAPPLEDMSLQPEGGGCRITGKWNSKQLYEIKLNPGIKLGSGTITDKPVTASVKSGIIPPVMSFPRGEQYYLPRRPGAIFPLASRNLDKVELTLHRMFPSNLVVALPSMEDGKGSQYLVEGWSEQVARKEIPVAKVEDRLAETPIELDALFPQDKRGVFCLTASSEGTFGRRRNWDRASEDVESYKQHISCTQLILWTDIGVLAHWQKGELVLFAHNLLSLAPLNMAKVTVYSAKNQLLGTANTDESGMVHMAPFDPALGEPRVAVVEFGNDFTVLELTTRQDDTRPFTEQMPRYDRKGYDAFIYADRDLYRPGETIHAHWTVRANYGDALADVPLLLTVLKPNGRGLLSQPTTLSTWGTGGIDLATEKNYPTGKYTVQLGVPGSKKTIGTYQFNLEEFVPNRIKTSVTVEQPRWRLGQEYPIVVNAQHLFGAPAADRKCEAIVIFKRGGFAPESLKGFQFDNDSQFTPEPVPCGDQVTDNAGNATFKFSYQPPGSVTFPMKAAVVGRVFELGGRPVSAKAEALYFPSEIALGVSVAAPASGKGMEVFAAAITPDEKPAALDKLNITLEKQVWNYYVRRYYSSHEPRWSESFQVVETREVPLAEGRGSTVFQPSDYGYYRVRVHSPATQQFSTLSFYCYGEEFQRVDTARPSLIKVTLDKDAYQIGEEAIIKVESPFDGKGIIVIQGEEIQKMIPVDIKDKVGVVRLPVTSDQFPNVWVEATVIHAVQTDRKQVHPFSSFAMTNLSVRDPQRLLTVTYAGLPAEIRPATEAKFDVQVADAAGKPVEAELTLAAVDEGIHGITNYANPDPFGWLCRTRQPDFRRAHYYDKVAYDFYQSATGGDALLRDLQKRMPSADENWIRPVALWSGVVRTDATGHVSVPMSVPEFTGQLRLVGVACTPTQLGAAGGNIFVRRPYMLRTSMPRFLLPDDAIRCRAVFFNRSDVACKARVNWSISGAFRSGTGSKEFDVAAHAESNFEAEFVAGARVGQGEIKWETTVFDANNQQVEHLVETSPIPVRAPAQFQSKYELVILNLGETREFRNTAFLDDERSEIELTLGASPLLRLQQALRYAVQYPYGCVEQTASCLMPLYLLRANSDLVAAALDERTIIKDYIHSGIDRLLSMQTSSGGMGAWPGSNDAYSFGSVYALHFLTMVKGDREYAIPEENFRALQGYVRSVALDWTNVDSSMLFLRAYALYVLAMDGDAEALRQIQRFDTITLPRYGRYLLAAALARNTQDVDRVKLYLSSAPSEPYYAFEPYGVLSSEIRNSAVELLALRQIGGHAEEALQLANKLVSFLETRGHGNTQETSFVISALVDYLAGLSANAQGAAATITNGDKQDTLSGPGVYCATRTGQGCKFAVANTGSCALFANITTRGVPEQAQIQAASGGGLIVNRSFFTKRGEPYAGAGFAQGDSYVVDVAMTCDKDLKNVVVVDMLPAGFEIENPRLDPDTLPGGAFKDGIRTSPRRARPEEGEQEDRSKQPIVASYLDVRDDRIVVALDTLPKGPHHFYYVVRGVTPGKYQHPPVSAECMYDAQVHSNSASAVAEVK